MNEPTWWVRHGREVDEALAGGDPSSIKQLYVNLGRFLEEDYGSNVESTPLLSIPETGPVVCRMLDDVRGVLLDAGCGPKPAVAIALASEAGRTVVALDIGLGTIHLALAHAQRAGVELLGVVGDVEALPFRSRAFAGGVCDDTIEHLPDDDRGASELGRVLAPGGRMVVATPNRVRLGVLLWKVRDRVRGRRRPATAYYAAESHLREYTWRQFTRLLAPHVAITRKASVGWSGSGVRWAATKLVSIPGPRWFSRMLVVEVEPRA
ncbi:MAG: Methyltransferase type 11 [Actinomycetia bacterium]|nr:Methyltransferase type 11 [Actinomycetes bacterium]